MDIFPKNVHPALIQHSLIFDSWRLAVHFLFLSNSSYNISNNVKEYSPPQSRGNLQAFCVSSAVSQQKKARKYSA